MNIEPLDPVKNGHEDICESFFLTEIDSFQALIEVVNEYSEKNSDSSVLITLDNLGQAQYTSMHATMTHDLDETEGHDLSSLDPSLFEDGEHQGYLSTKSEFFIREKNFISSVKGVAFSRACCRGLTLEIDEIKLIDTIHKDPMEYIDRDVILRVVPVKNSALAVAAFPNGYFQSDLDPSESYIVAARLEEQYGYKLFGIGATLLGFRKTRDLDNSELKNLTDDLVRLYNQENEGLIRELFLKHCSGEEFLFLKYTESLDDS